MSFTIRYIDVFIDEFKRVKISMASRGYVDNGLMLLAPGAFIVLGLIIWLQRTKTGYVEE